MINFRNKSFSFSNSLQNKEKPEEVPSCKRRWSFTRRVWKRNPAKNTNIHTKSLESDSKIGSFNIGPLSYTSKASYKTNLEYVERIKEKSLQAVIEEAKKDLLINKITFEPEYVAEDYVNIQDFKQKDNFVILSSDYVEMC